MDKIGNQALIIHLIGDFQEGFFFFPSGALEKYKGNFEASSLRKT